MTELKRIEIIIDEKNNRFKILYNNVNHATVIKYLAESMIHIINDSYMGDKVEFIEILMKHIKQCLIELNKEK